MSNSKSQLKPLTEKIQILTDWYGSINIDAEIKICSKCGRGLEGSLKAKDFERYIKCEFCGFSIEFDYGDSYSLWKK